MSTWMHPKTDRRIDRLSKLDAKSEKYCWAQLAYLGMTKHNGEEAECQKEQARTGNRCKQESIKEGTCWCHKFVDGKIKEESE
jgi:hypothetical protein